MTPVESSERKSARRMLLASFSRFRPRYQTERLERKVRGVLIKNFTKSYDRYIQVCFSVDSEEYIRAHSISAVLSYIGPIINDLPLSYCLNMNVRKNSYKTDCAGQYILFSFGRWRLGCLGEGWPDVKKKFLAVSKIYSEYQRNTDELEAVSWDSVYSVALVSAFCDAIKIENLKTAGDIILTLNTMIDESTESVGVISE
jgi:hypothetical protein